MMMDAQPENIVANSCTEANPVIHGMWIGTSLSRLELLTIASFLRHGHEFHLWAYDDIVTPLPQGTILRDASTVMDRALLFRKRAADPETGVGAGSLSGVSSDMFRYRVLYEHGGIWADMDVTCLRPFDFTTPYLFRAHHVGVVGSIMKAPRGSAAMARAYELTAAIANEDTPWLEPLRILTQVVNEHDLTRYVRDDIANPDHWTQFIRPLTEHDQALPDSWFAIHWMNEFFRTLKQGQGKYKGEQLIAQVPDKEAPRPGSVMHELYRAYKLLDPLEPFEAPSPPRATLTILPPPPRSLNMLVASLTRGGAERIVVETAQALASAGVAVTLYVLHDVQLDYKLPKQAHLVLQMLKGSREEKLRTVALALNQAGQHVLQTHLIEAADLEFLWALDLRTIPVVHNTRLGWKDAATAYDHPQVPLVVAVADIVAAQLLQSGLKKPVTTIRHEIQRRVDPADLPGWRRSCRRRHDIKDDVLLLGMVGQFKLQKAYTRAVEVLARLRQQGPAKLMIIGSWDHEYGSGRAAYEAAMRRAVELGVVADVIVPGNLHPVEPYYAAFDVFLNTSLYEGLSISLLEALAHGCPVVAADAGGNREILPPEAVLIEDGDDIEAYAQACRAVARRSLRQVATKPHDADLIPQLWTALTPELQGDPASALFLIQDLEIGGPARSLNNLLSGTRPDRKWLVGCVGAVQDALAAGLSARQIPVLGMSGGAGLAAQAQSVIHWLQRYRLGTLVIWNLCPELKLLLAKWLEHSAVRIIDVSPGPMLFDELAAAEDFGRRIAFSVAQYFARLDHFVSLYEGGQPDPALYAPDKTSVIPLGVPVPPSFIKLPAPEWLLPPGFDPALALGTCCRIVPDKKLEFLIEMMDLLAPRLPGVSLTIVGGPDARSGRYFLDLIESCAGRPYIRFVGPQEDVMPFLGQFQLFVMVSERQGCPNASLEAMAMGLPVVANNSGGTAEQVIHGVTGYLADTPAEMMRRVRTLLRQPAKRQRMAAAALAHVRTNFSMTAMNYEYDRLIVGNRMA
jgi:glycosyltransferase involved in cell wall biosynthesis